MGHHSNAFVALVDEAKAHIKEISTDDVKQRLDVNEPFYLIDVREDHEWQMGHLPAAVHLGRGILERDIEAILPDYDTDIVLYCGGGYRSALSAFNLQKMGYTRVKSLAGGIREWAEKKYPLAR